VDAYPAQAGEGRLAVRARRKICKLRGALGERRKEGIAMRNGLVAGDAKPAPKVPGGRDRGCGCGHGLRSYVTRLDIAQQMVII
jgi:hypothetical protein